MASKTEDELVTAVATQLVRDFCEVAGDDLGPGERAVYAEYARNVIRVARPHLEQRGAAGLRERAASLVDGWFGKAFAVIGERIRALPLAAPPAEPNPGRVEPFEPTAEDFARVNAMLAHVVVEDPGFVPGIGRPFQPEAQGEAPPKRCPVYPWCLCAPHRNICDTGKCWRRDGIDQQSQGSGKTGGGP